VKVTTSSLLNEPQFDINRNFISASAVTSLYGFALSTFAPVDDPPRLFLFIRSHSDFTAPTHSARRRVLFPTLAPSRKLNLSTVGVVVLHEDAAGALNSALPHQFGPIWGGGGGVRNILPTVCISFTPVSADDIMKTVSGSIYDLCNATNVLRGGTEIQTFRQMYSNGGVDFGSSGGPVSAQE
jgi:hypothetical protein